MMDTKRLKNGWYLTTRPAKNDIMVSAFDPAGGWPDVLTAVFISKTARGRYTLACIEGGRENGESAAEWVIGGTSKSFGFRFTNRSRALCKVVGRLLDGRSDGFLAINSFFGGDTYAGFCQNARGRLPGKLAYYKWEEALGKEMTRATSC